MVGDTILGTIASTPLFPSISNQISGLLQFNMTNVIMQIIDVDAFSSMVSQLVLSPSSSFNLSGVATAMVRSQIGDLVLTNITFRDQLIQLNGMQIITTNSSAHSFFFIFFLFIQDSMGLQVI